MTIDANRRASRATGGGGKTAIIVVNYGSTDLLRNNLVKIATQMRDLQIVVIDNFSNDANRSQCRTLCAAQDWVLIESANIGFGSGMNLGVARAIDSGAQRFLLLNPDAVIDSDAVDRLISIVTEDPMTLVSPTVLRPDGTVWFGGSDLYLRTGNMRSTIKRVPGADPTSIEPWLSGACLMISEALWIKLDGFRDEYFLYWEDVDLSYRARQLGATLLVDTIATAIHDEGGTQEAASGASRAKSPIYYYYNTRNRLLFAALNLEPNLVHAWLDNQRQSANEILLRGGRRQFLHPWKPLSASLRGSRDGRRIAKAALAKAASDNTSAPTRPASRQ